LSSRRPKGGGILYRATSTLGPFVASLLRASDRREREKHPFGRLLVSSRRPKGGGILYRATSTLDPFVASLLRASDRREREKHPFGRLLVSSRRPKGGGILQCATSTLDPFVASLLRASERHEREKHPFGRLLVSSRAQPPLVIPTTEGRRDPIVRDFQTRSLGKTRLGTTAAATRPFGRLPGGQVNAA
jgi:hypothetical protein